MESTEYIDYIDADYSQHIPEPEPEQVRRSGWQWFRSLLSAASAMTRRDHGVTAASRRTVSTP